MYDYLITIYYKQQPTTPSADQFLHPAILRAGDRYSKVFNAKLRFNDGSDAAVLKDVFTLFNNPHDEIPGLTQPLPRSLSVGDIICGVETIAYLVTETAFVRLGFRPRSDEFEVTAEHLARPKPPQREKPRPLPTADINSGASK